MKTLILTADETQILYDKLRNALEIVNELITDAAAFPEEFDADQIEDATGDAALINSVLNKLAAPFTFIS